jgi:hypothetical protein
MEAGSYREVGAQLSRLKANAPIPASLQTFPKLAIFMKAPIPVFPDSGKPRISPELYASVR